MLNYRIYYIGSNI